MTSPAIADNKIRGKTSRAIDNKPRQQHAQGQTSCNFGNFINSDDALYAAMGMCSLFHIDDDVKSEGKSLTDFPGGRKVDKVVYTHNSAQVYICGWGVGKGQPIKPRDIIKIMHMIRRACGGTFASTGEVWFPDLDYAIGYARVDKAICKPKNLRHRFGRMLGFSHTAKLFLLVEFGEKERK